MWKLMAGLIWPRWQASIADVGRLRQALHRRGTSTAAGAPGSALPKT
jgi:hypothetical protein